MTTSGSTRSLSARSDVAFVILVKMNGVVDINSILAREMYIL